MFRDEVIAAKVVCPYCGERIELVVDRSAGSQQYVEDCQVCCRPMDVRIGVDAVGTLSLDVRSEDS